MTTAVFAPPSFRDAARHGAFWTIILLRAVLLGIAIFAISEVVDLGTTASALVLTGLFGTAIGSMVAFSRLRTRGFLTICALCYCLYSVFFSIVERLFSGLTATVFGTYVAQLHVDLAALTFGIGAIAAWYFWRFRHWLTAEIITLAALGVYLLSGHRNYRFDTPRLINNLAWRLNVDELTVIVSLGVSICLFLLLYLFVATLPGRPTPDSRHSAEAQSAKTSWLAWATALALVGVILFGIAREIYGYNVAAAGSRLSNGVGEAQTSGLTPLGFHSALGATNQPSALVRLEGDYSENPFSPMLYLREQALSEFNGKEMVVADRTYDRDTTDSTPVQPYTTDPDLTLEPRVPLRQSVYLLTEHKLAFAVDFPISIKPLVNPNPSRFRAAYQAYSMAPAFPLTDLRGASVGDPRWSADTLAHYLKKHEDPRYQNLADTLTQGVTDPIEKIGKLVTYLDENAIYTLTPNHNVGPNDDPVAPFLFGDMRGYCVHFAHAMVYLLRAAGIPARIGTGYLTDLSESKDGHILLRMSDRHAWSEVYITGKGWVPFDVQPQHVESHGETPVDQKLLEELMQSLDPPEEELPKDIAKDEPGMHDEKPFWIDFLPSQSILLSLALMGLLIPFATKLYLRFGWALPGTPEIQAVRTYRSIVSRLFDLGLRRYEGETRIEFEHRVRSILGPTALSATDSINTLRYAPPHKTAALKHDLVTERSQALAASKILPWWQRCVGALNPASVISFFIGGRF